MTKTILAVTVIVSLASVFNYIETRTQAYKVSQITGTPYFTILTAHHKLMLSGRTDTDCSIYDGEVGLKAEVSGYEDDENCNGPCESNQN